MVGPCRSTPHPHLPRLSCGRSTRRAPARGSRRSVRRSGHRRDDRNHADGDHARHRRPASGRGVRRRARRAAARRRVRPGARDAGAVAIVTDEQGAAVAAATGLPVIVVDDPRAQLGELSAWVYGTDSDMPRMFAITGTNGKTSVSHLVEAMLQGLGLVTGLSSTAERHIAGHIIPSRLTTPEASEMHALLALMRERGVEAVMVEVSAQALTRHRVDGLLLRRRRLHQPHPRPPRRLRRHGDVLRGEAGAVPARPFGAGRRLRRLRRRAVEVARRCGIRRDHGAHRGDRDRRRRRRGLAASTCSTNARTAPCSASRTGTVGRSRPRCRSSAVTWPPTPVSRSSC